MKIHEYQSKEILRSLGIEIPAQYIATTSEEATEAGEKFGYSCAVKAQVHSGGRGKAGGIRLCSSREEVRSAAKSLIGKKLITKQSGGKGLYIPSVLIAEKIETEREIYLSITIDTKKLQYVILMSGCGGVDIEETAKKDKDQILKVFVPKDDEIRPFQIQYLADMLHLNRNLMQQLAHILRSGLLYMKKNDASLIEINPLAVANDTLIAADAKISYDDNALYRHHDIAEMEDFTQIDALEQEACRIGLAYIKLSGNIACLVNGAGLAMATMDILKSYGGEPANFMDVGGGVGADKVTAAFELILKDKSVKTIFVNIFGGIAKCDVIAEGIVQATQKTGLNIPLVVRLRGTNEEKGREILHNSGLEITVTEDFTKATKIAISCARGAK